MKKVFSSLLIIFAIAVNAQENTKKGMMSHISSGFGVISDDQFGGNVYDACFNVGYCFKQGLTLTGGLHYLDPINYDIKYLGPNIITTYYFNQNKIKPFIGIKSSWNFRFLTENPVNDDIQVGLHAGLSVHSTQGKCDYAVYLSHEYIGINHHQFKNALMINFAINAWSFD